MQKTDFKIVQSEQQIRDELTGQTSLNFDEE